LRQLTEDKQRTLAKLAAARAWHNCLESLTEFRRENLLAWAVTMKKIGKGTGKRAPMLRRQAQKYLDNCKQAIPAWIMPLHRVFETVSPETEVFDVVIIDEASQTGPEGLVIQYLARQCIVVGDAEQISPEAEWVPHSAVDGLAKRYLAGIPFADLYGPETSLFHHANIRFPSKIVLREHFRCMPEIIQFSNDLCYAATPLKPLRQYPPKRLEPVVVKPVLNGYREGSVGRALNRPEADQLVNTLLEICSLREYANKSIGVISLQGEEQARYIESQLLKRMPAAELQKRRVVCGDAYAFQGDERDVILLSMVAAPNERIGALVRESDKRRFNVAASRAKDQVILFHTATLNDLNPECMRHKLLKYYLNPVRQQRKVSPSVFDSQFEKDVYEAISSKGYAVFPQYEVGGYRIDMVVQGMKSQLAVECDGDEWHGPDAYESDVARQRILERCGWRFWRIRGCEYYRAPLESLKSLWLTLSEMDIHPAGETPTAEEEQPGLADQGEAQLDEESWDPDDANPPRERAEPEPNEETLTETPVKSTTPKADGKSSSSQGSLGLPQSPIYDYSPTFFFALARWAKQANELQGWQRRLIFSVGDYRARNWTLSEKQERAALRIIELAGEAGFTYDEHEGSGSGKEDDLQGRLFEGFDSPPDAADPKPPEPRGETLFRSVSDGTLSLPTWWTNLHIRPQEVGLILEGDRLLITLGTNRSMNRKVRYTLATAMITLPSEWLGNTQRVSLRYKAGVFEVTKLPD
jgi:very-short-patch-repair endonuclease